MVKNHQKEIQKPSVRPAFTADERENQLIALSMDAAERKIKDGTASNQLLCHFLKLGTSKERLEKENLRNEIELKRAKKEALESQKHIEELYTNALRAMQDYSGQRIPDEVEE